MEYGLLILLSFGMTVTAAAIGFAAAKFSVVASAIDALPKRELLSAQMMGLTNQISDLTRKIQTIDDRLMAVDADVPHTPRGMMPPGMYDAADLGGRALPGMGAGPPGSMVPFKGIPMTGLNDQADLQQATP